MDVLIAGIVVLVVPDLHHRDGIVIDDTAANVRRTVADAVAGQIAAANKHTQ